MDVVHTRADCTDALDRARAAGRTVGLVPTMGALHAGHTSLIARARAECDVVAVTIFVNPLQFGDPGDIAAYPRTLEHDLAACAEAGADLVFAPSVCEMYPGWPAPPATTVSVRGVSDDWEGASRPGHFDGVATVVAKLFSVAGRCRAYFGLKDFQQLAVVRQLTEDLALPVELVGCPIVREPDGLALSSRNVRLSPSEPLPPGVPRWPRESARRPRCARSCGPSSRASHSWTSTTPRSSTPAPWWSPRWWATSPACGCSWRPGSGRCGSSTTAPPPPRISSRGPPAGRQSAVPLSPWPTGPDNSKGSGEPMRRRMMKSKIHRATVTGANLDYVGSVSIDTELMALADILPYEQVAVLDIDNGARFETYAIEGERGQICLNGAAARLVAPGDKVIIITYADYDREELDHYAPRVVHVDGRNRVIDEASARLDAELSLTEPA